MPKKRVLIVDDSVVIRRSLAGELSDSLGLEIVGSAPSGRIALMKIRLLQPDVVILDVEMPEMDGVETLTAIRKASPGIAVIMLSVSSEEGAAATLEALSRGAKDYLVKPEVAAILEGGLQKFSSELAARIDAIGTAPVEQTAVSASPAEATSGPNTIDGRATRSPGRVDAVAIGVSTGGPNALMELLSGFPADFPVPILIVQHMPPVFTKLLAGRLAKTCKIRVAEGSSHQTIGQGSVWIAPGDFHMSVERKGETVRIRTEQGRPENSCRPAVDVLFRSVAKVYGPHALGVVMTGMGEDGFRGCQQIRAAGGYVLVQDEASSVVWGMPSAVVRAGIADQIVSLRDLPEEISSRVWSHRPRKSVLVGC
jgi:two-component system, chemotaxis family, protein-glutamate methylesterase/glutaminase